MRMVGIDVVGADDQTPSGKLSTWDIIKKETPALAQEGQQIYDDTQKKPGAAKKPGDNKPPSDGGGSSGENFLTKTIAGGFKVWHLLVSVLAAGVGGVVIWKLRK